MKTSLTRWMETAIDRRTFLGRTISQVLLVTGGILGFRKVASALICQCGNNDGICCLCNTNQSGCQDNCALTYQGCGWSWPSTGTLDGFNCNFTCFECYLLSTPCRGTCHDNLYCYATYCSQEILDGCDTGDGGGGGS
jgi:hypothetical protein